MGINGAQANGYNVQPDISSDGRFVAFLSDSSTLVQADTNGAPDIFVFDRVTKTTERVSLGNSGLEANGESSTPSISSDGRYISFLSTANNLVPGDTNGKRDAFVFDRIAKSTARASISNSGTQANRDIEYAAISGNGRFVTFNTLSTNLTSGPSPATPEPIYVFDRLSSDLSNINFNWSGTATSRQFTGSPSLNENGNSIAFELQAINFEAGETANIVSYDRTTQVLTAATYRNATSSLKISRSTMHLRLTLT